MPKKNKSNAAKILEKLMEDKYYDGWWLLVERVGNGVIITRNPEGKGTIPYTEVISEPKMTDLEDPMDESELDARFGENLAWAVLDYFGLTGSKHNKYRISIEVRKQRTS